MSGMINALDAQGTSLQFSEFAKLAEKGSSKVVRFLGGQDAQTVHEVAVTKSDRVWALSRSDATKQANNITRTIFRDSVAAMFGGMDRIPDSVKTAMRLKDFGKDGRVDSGKPLTARRILIVKTAIEKAMASFPLERPRIASPGANAISAGPDGADGLVGAREATAMGYAPAEFGKLEKTADLYQKATGCDKATAQKAALDPKSDARRLMDYGGIFTADAQSFAKGLALIRSFGDWYDGYLQTAEGKKGGVLTHDTKLAVEKFAFEEISANPKLSLDEEDPAQLFHPSKNAAVKFIQANAMQSVSITMANMAPEKRSLVYALTNALDRTAPNDEHWPLPNTILARVLKNPAKAAELVHSGNLTRQKVFDALMPDLLKLGLSHTSTNTEISTAMSNLLNYTDEQEEAVAQGDMDLGRQITMKSVMTIDMVNRSGESIQTCMKAAQAGKKLPAAPGMLEITSGVADATGFTDAGQKQFLGDINRPKAPMNPKTQQSLITEENNVFRFKIGNQEMVASKDSNENNAHNTGIAGTISDFCNAKVHPRQASAVFFALSQSGLMPLTEITGSDYSCNEHGAVTFTLSKDAQTGSVKIDYSEPEGSPVKFHWSTTIDIDGNVTSTPPERLRA